MLTPAGNITSQPVCSATCSFSPSPAANKPVTCNNTAVTVATKSVEFLDATVVVVVVDDDDDDDDDNDDDDDDCSVAPRAAND